MPGMVSRMSLLRSMCPGPGQTSYLILVSTISQHVSEAAPPNRSIIIDAFCGVGGNTIAFALSGKWKRVYGIEKDAATLACAKHNAEIYGVSDKITWFHGDCFEILGAMDGRTEKTVDALKAIAGQFGIIFASPPWGGTVLELTIEVTWLTLIQDLRTATLKSLTWSRWSLTRSVISTSPSER